MIISNSKKYIFVHLKKCGGTSITHALEKEITWKDIVVGRTEYGRNMKASWGKRWGVGTHSSAKTIASLVGQNIWSEYFTFAFVRHPFRRILSWYSWTEKLVKELSWRRYARHIHSRWDYDKWHWDTVQAYLNTKSFSEYIRHPAMANALSSETQARSLSDKGGNLMIDYYGKVENMKSDFETICQRIGSSVRLPSKNTSKSTNVEFSDDDITYIQEKQTADYNLFNYII